MTVDHVHNSRPPSGDALLHDTSQPFAARLGRLVRAWTESGREADWLVSGDAFFAAWCWHLADARRSEQYDGETVAYLRSAHAAIGGAPGWNALLRRRDFCSCHGDQWRLENISICLGCMRYVCYQLDGPCPCGRSEIVG
ncbi:hypothetical protein ACGFZP_07055 [Kitasatospora sp. NPDC048239]|uniref:hypothetical protein n=1 Tax=Kitasatospora sp. NPDC048239 TaxID=3364046 RepID=UPI003718A21C